jgi:hypothetical protein
MRRAPVVVRLTEDEVKTLSEWTRRGRSEHRLVERAQIILMSAEGTSVEEIAERLHTRTSRVSKWRQRFVRYRLPALSDAPRCGKPAHFVPAYSSWLNQVECWFSILGRAAPRGGGFHFGSAVMRGHRCLRRGLQPEAAPFEVDQGRRAPVRTQIDLLELMQVSTRGQNGNPGLFQHENFYIHTHSVARNLLIPNTVRSNARITLTSLAIN